jgi:ribonuclease P protein component
MLDATARMRAGSEFARTIRAGRRAGRRTLVVHLADDPNDPAVRAGVVVSKAIGGAVERNRVARRLRPLIRARLAGLPAGARLVVRALPPAGTARSRELGADLDAALAAATRPRAGVR